MEPSQRTTRRDREHPLWLRVAPLRLCSTSIVWPFAIPEQLFVHVPRHIRRKPIADRPHRPNDSSITSEQHSCRDVNGLVGENLVTYCCLTRREKGRATARTRQSDDVRYLQATFIGETESAIRRIRGILDPVADKMDPVGLLHQSKYFLDSSDRGFQEGDACCR